MASIKKRWLFWLGEAITVIVPLAIVIEAAIKIDPDRTVAVQLAGFVIGCIYLAFVAKKVRRAIAKLKDGAWKTLVGGLSDTIPFVVAGLLVYLAEHLFGDFDRYIVMVVVSMLIGTILKTVENVINKDYLHGVYIDRLATEQAEIETRKNELIAEKTKVA